VSEKTGRLLKAGVFLDFPQSFYSDFKAVDPFKWAKTISFHAITYCPLKVTLQFHSALHITSLVKTVSSNIAKKIQSNV
jgi:hypothetical protein